MKKLSLLSFHFALLAAWAVLATGCMTAPETGRSQLSLVPESQVEQESKAAFAQMKKQTPISKDAKQNQMVKDVAMRIVAAARNSQGGSDLPPPNKWEFVVFKDDKTINAFAMPGGKVGVYSGMFKVAKTNDALAIVLGHEIAHVAAKHGDERISQAEAAQVAGQLGAILLGQSDMSPAAQQTIMQAYGAGAEYGVLLPFSRTQESEADHIGLLYSARAGFDPRAAIPFWQDMSRLGGATPPVFLSDHPSNETRISDLQAEMPTAMAEYQKAIGKKAR
jgi:predicted Zn-dependent protease